MPVHPEPNEKLEVVFDTADETEAMVVQGVLESAGIKSMMVTPDAPDVMPLFTGVALKVRAEQAEEARRLIQEYRASGGSEIEQVELEEGASPAESEET